MPGDNIYPDYSNSQFDIQYARLLGLSSDLQASNVTGETGSSPPIKTPDDNSTGFLRFAVAAEDDLATQNRSFDLAAGFSFALTQLGNNHFLVDPPNGLYQLGAIPVPGSDSGLSYTYLEVNDTDSKIILQAPEGIVLPGYGYGNHSGTAAFNLAVEEGGRIIEVAAGGGGYTNLTEFVDQNNWKVFYSDGSGDVKELSIGASGDVLTSNGASSVPSWETPSGGGTPAGSDREVQFNNAGAFGASSGFVFNSAGELLINTTDKGAFKLQVEGHTYLGSSTITVDATPSILNLGGSIADEYGGTAPAKLKIKLWDGGGSAICGIGVGQTGSNRNLDYVVDAAAGNHTFWVNGVSVVRVYANELRISDTSGSSTTNPPFISMGMETSSVAGQNPKIRMLNLGSGGNSFGFGVSAGQLDYMVTANNSHVFYIGTVERFKVGGTNINSTITSGAATQVLLRLKLDSSQSANAFEVNSSAGSGGDIFRVASDGKTLIGSMAQDDAEDKVVVWNSTDKVLEWRDAGTLGGGGSVTADNGLIKSSATNVQLGATTSGSANSPLLHNSFINTASFKLTVYGEHATNEALLVNNFSGGVGFSSVTSSGTSIYSQSNSGFVLHGVLTNSNQNAVRELVKLDRQTTGGGGAGQAGIGLSIGMYNNTSTNAGRLSNEIISKFTTATEGSQTSELKFTGVLSSSTVDLLTLAGDGSVKLRPITATAASAITPAEGMLVFTSDTNGTFPSIGIYCYENATWNKL